MAYACFYIKIVFVNVNSLDKLNCRLKTKIII